MKKMNEFMKKYGFWIGVFCIAILIGYIIFSDSEEPIACTADAKLCPDGSYVGRVPPDCEFEACPVSKACEFDEDCAVFGEDGDCSCGCYNKGAMPQDSGGDCFCAAPKNCRCINRECVGVFE